MDTLKNILKNVLYGYIRKGINGSTELTRNVDETLFTLIASGKSGEKRFTFTALIVIIIADKIVIEEDRNDKPLVDALVQAGIPREQIILAYIGEKVPDLSA
ncbi:MAG: element excision factor XisI family protein [Phototrophicaceae bacterium]